MILVTGGSGLVGTELIAQLLAEGKIVKAIYHHTPLPFPSQQNLVQVKGDLLDVIGLEEIMEGVDEVYHCAGFVSFIPADETKLYKVNIEGTANVVNAALLAGVRKMVHVSSVAALGRLRKDAMVDETMVWTEETSNSKYGKSKYYGELEVWRGIAEGLDAVIVNPSIILGPGDWNDGSTKIFQSVYNEFPWYTDGTSGFVDVRDLVAAMIALMESDISAEKFIVSGHNETYQNVFNHIADAFGKKRPTKKVTPLLASIVVMLEKIKYKFSGKRPLITKETADTGFATIQYSNDKLLKALPGFSFTPINETIAHTCKALQQKLNTQ